MSKSLGNFFTIREILDKSPVSKSEAITGECLRYYLLSTHYRSDLNFSERSLPEAKAAMDNIYGLLQRLEECDTQESNQGDDDWERLSKEFANKFQESMDDDFNTPKVLGAFHEFRSGINKLLAKGLSNEARKTIVDNLRKYGKPLGLFQLGVNQWKAQIIKSEPVVVELKIPLPKVEASLPDENKNIEQQIQLRNEARAKKDFATSDTIRKDLADQGIILEDRPDGSTRWKR